MKTKWMVMAALAGLFMTGSALHADSRFSIGIGIGTPGYYAPPPPVIAYRPPYPGPGYYWVDGYYNPYGSWVGGYWAPPAYRYGYVAPRYYAPPRYYAAPRYYGGYSRGFRDGRDWDRGRRR